MHPHTITALVGIVLAAVFHLHLALTTAGLTITISVPWAIVASVGGTAIVLVCLTVREVTGFRILRG